MMFKKTTKNEGFTLIEIIIVVLIIGMIATLVGPKLFKQLGKGKQGTAKAQIELIGQALDLFRLDIGRYPTESEGLDALMNNPGIESWDGPYPKKAIPNDPWGNPYQYKSPGEHGDYDLFSYGLDGNPGGEGENADIISWE